MKKKRGREREKRLDDDVDYFYIMLIVELFQSLDFGVAFTIPCHDYHRPL